MIYTAPIDLINWSDIEAFCEEKRTENSYLDYKKDFSAKLDKTIASMANTIGGVILIGVDEDAESKPLLPIQGIEAAEKLEERVMSIILDNIMPPVFPEIRVCRSDSKERAIVMIRIHQSEQAPHAIARNTAVYLRTGNVSKPEDLAEVDNIDWLKNRREKCVLLRESLLSRAEQRAHSKTRHFNGPLITLACSPLYPSKLLAELRQLKALRSRILLTCEMESFPAPSHFEGAYAHETLLFEDRQKAYSPYTEINVFGTYFHQSGISTKPNNAEQEECIYLDHIFTRLYLMLSSTEKLYRELGYWGPVWFKLQFSALAQVRIKRPSDWRLGGVVSRDPTITILQTLPRQPIDDDKIAFLVSVAESIVFAFGWEPIVGDLRTYFQQPKFKEI